jgi:thiamine-phosphate pyrophosphorylase
VGVDELRRLRGFTVLPLVAIGGITRINAHNVLAAGADSVAIIGDLIPQDGSIHSRVREWVAVLK